MSRSGASRQPDSPQGGMFSFSGGLRAMVAELVVGLGICGAAVPSVSAQEAPKPIMPPQGAYLLPPVEVRQSNVERIGSERWVKGTELTTPVVLTTAEAECVYRRIPADRLAPEHKDLHLYEYASDPKKGPDGFIIVTDLGNPERIVGRTTYPKDVFARIVAEYPHLKETWKATIAELDALGPNHANYGLFVNPSVEHRSLGGRVVFAQHGYRFLKLFGSDSTETLFPEKGPFNARQREVFATLALWSAEDPGVLRSLESLLTMRKLPPPQVKLHVELIGVFSKGVEGLVKEMRREYPWEQISVRSSAEKGTYSFTLEQKGRYDRSYEVTVRPTDVGELLYTSITYKSAGSAPRALDIDIIGKRAGGNITQLHVPFLTIPLAEVAELPWKPRAEVAEFKVPAGAGEFDIVRQVGARFREIPQSLRPAHLKDARLVEYTLGKSRSPYGFVTLYQLQSGWMVQGIHPYGNNGFDRLNALPSGVPTELKAAERTFSEISPEHRNIAFHLSQAQTHAKLRRGLDEATARAGLEIRLEPLGGLDRIAKLTPKTGAMNAQDRTVAAGFYLSNLSDAERRHLTFALVSRGMKVADVTELCEQWDRIHEIAGSASSDLKAGRPENEPSPSLSADGEKLVLRADFLEPKTYRVTVEIEAGPKGSYVIGGVKRDSVAVDDAARYIGREASPTEVLKALRTGMLPSKEGIELVDGMNRAFGIDKAKLAELLRNDLSRNFLSGIDSDTKHSFAAYVLDAGRNWKDAARIGKSLGLVREGKAGLEWHTDTFTTAEFDRAVKLLYLAREPGAPLIIERLIAMKAPLNFSWELPRTTPSVADLSTIRILAAEMKGQGTQLADYSDRPELFAQNAKRADHFDLAISRTLRKIRTAQERELASSPELTPERTMRPVRVVVVYDASLRGHTYTAQALRSALNVDSRRSPTETLLCVNDMTEATLTRRLDEIRVEAARDDHQVLLIPLVHGMQRANGTILEFRDAKKNYSVDDLRARLDPKGTAYVFQMSCTGGGLPWRESPPKERLENLAMLTSYTVFPLLIEANPARLIQDAMEVEERTVVVDGKATVMKLRRCDFDGKGPSIRRALFYMNQQIPLINGWQFGSTGEPLSYAPDRRDDRRPDILPQSRPDSVSA